jgi:hypothetical protein
VVCLDGQPDGPADERDGRQQLLDQVRLTRLRAFRVSGLDQQRAHPVAADQQRMIDPAMRSLMLTRPLPAAVALGVKPTPLSWTAKASE